MLVLKEVERVPIFSIDFALTRILMSVCNIECRRAYDVHPDFIEVRRQVYHKNLAEFEGIVKEDFEERIAPCEEGHFGVSGAVVRLTTLYGSFRESAIRRIVDS